MTYRERDDIDKFIEIEILITDIHLNEYKETLLYPCSHMAIKWEEDGSYSYIGSVLDNFKTECAALRVHPIAHFSNKNNILYNPDNVLRIKFDDRWVKVK